MRNKFESLEERVRRHLRIPVKAKLEWLEQMLRFNSSHQLKLRQKLRSISRS